MTNTPDPNRLDRFDRTIEWLAASNADLCARQISTQKQIDSLMVLCADTRQAAMVLLQISVRHEGRLDDLEQGNQP